MARLNLNRFNVCWIAGVTPPSMDFKDSSSIILSRKNTFSTWVENPLRLLLWTWLLVIPLFFWCPIFRVEFLRKFYRIFFFCENWRISKFDESGCELLRTRTKLSHSLFGRGWFRNSIKMYTFNASVHFVDRLLLPRSLAERLIFLEACLICRNVFICFIFGDARMMTST